MSDKPGGNLDALFRQARQAGGTSRAKQVNDEDREQSGGDSPRVSAASDTERLMLVEGRDGRARYMLDGDDVRVGDDLEVYVNDANGWLYGTFQWTGRERHPPSLKVALNDPENPGSFVGSMDATLPKHARVRRA